MKVFLGIPSRSGLCTGTVCATHSAGTRHSVEQMKIRSTSMLTMCFNELWCDALNSEGCDVFCMLHDDVVPTPGWLDVMVDELLASGADILSAVIPIKDFRGISSTAFMDKETGRPRRLTMTEAQQLRTFDAETAGYPDHHLLINTGLWVCRLNQDWNKEVCFTVRDRIVEIDGKYYAQGFSEDWMFGLWASRRGLKVMATTKVPCKHVGAHEYPSGAWGAWETDISAARSHFEPWRLELVTEAAQVVQ